MKVNKVILFFLITLLIQMKYTVKKEVLFEMHHMRKLFIKLSFTFYLLSLAQFQAI